MASYNIRTGKITDITKKDLKQVVKRNKDVINLTSGTDAQDALNNIENRTEAVKKQVQEVANNPAFVADRTSEWVSSFNGSEGDSGVNQQKIQDLVTPTVGLTTPDIKLNRFPTVKGTFKPYKGLRNMVKEVSSNVKKAAYVVGGVGLAALLYKVVKK